MAPEIFKRKAARVVICTLFVGACVAWRQDREELAPPDLGIMVPVKWSEPACINESVGLASDGRIIGLPSRVYVPLGCSNVWFRSRVIDADQQCRLQLLYFAAVLSETSAHASGALSAGYHFFSPPLRGIGCFSTVRQEQGVVDVSGCGGFLVHAGSNGVRWAGQTLFAVDQGRSECEWNRTVLDEALRVGGDP